MLIQDRIKLIIKANNESPSFADKIDIQRSNLSHVLSGRNKPSLDFLAKIITTYPSVNASWLVTGVTRKEDVVEERKVAPQPKSELDIDKAITSTDIERIVIFYKDGTFREYRGK